MNRHKRAFWSTDDIEDFGTFYELANTLIADASKYDVEKAARHLALNLAHRQLGYGALALKSFTDMLRVQTIDSET